MDSMDCHATASAVSRNDDEKALTRIHFLHFWRLSVIASRVSGAAIHKICASRVIGLGVVARFGLVDCFGDFIASQ